LSAALAVRRKEGPIVTIPFDVIEMSTPAGIVHDPVSLQVHVPVTAPPAAMVKVSLSQYGALGPEAKLCIYHIPNRSSAEYASAFFRNTFINVVPFDHVSVQDPTVLPESIWH
jgi:hypothetical protein